MLVPDIPTNVPSTSKEVSESRATLLVGKHSWLKQAGVLRESCLLILNSVTSTPQRICQPRPEPQIPLRSHYLFLT